LTRIFTEFSLILPFNRLLDLAISVQFVQYIHTRNVTVTVGWLKSFQNLVMINSKRLIMKH